MGKHAQGTDPLTLYFNPSCTSEKETPYEDNSYYYSDYLVLLQVLENKRSETYKIEGLACITL